MKQLKNYIKDYRVLFVLLIISIISSCKYFSVHQMLTTMMSHPIEFPSSMSLITEEDSLIDISFPSERPILVIYVDSTECALCRVNHFVQYDKIQERFENKIKVVLIITPRKEDYSEAIHIVSARRMSVPVYLDQGNEFGSLNESITDDIRFHAFLLDESNIPVIVGDPVQNPKVRAMMLDYIR